LTRASMMSGNGKAILLFWWQGIMDCRVKPGNDR
jgi:hypothetical protein